VAGEIKIIAAAVLAGAVGLLAWSWSDRGRQIEALERDKAALLATVEMKERESQVMAATIRRQSEAVEALEARTALVVQASQEAAVRAAERQEATAQEIARLRGLMPVSGSEIELCREARLLLLSP
jgi:nitrogen fixation-related uncharacterized protein